MRIYKNLKRPCAFQRILNSQPSHIQCMNILNMELGFYVTEMRKNKSKVCLVKSSFGHDQHFHSTMDCIPLPMAPLLFVMEQN